MPTSPILRALVTTLLVAPVASGLGCHRGAERRALEAERRAAEAEARALEALRAAEEAGREREAAQDAPDADAERPGPPADAAPYVVTVSQDGSGDFDGDTGRAIQAAIDAVIARGGGEVRVGPGTYVVRRPIRFQDARGLVIRGTGDALLRLPSPVLVTADAPKGQDHVLVSSIAELAADTAVQVLPPDGQETFPDGETPFIPFAMIAAVEEGRVRFPGPIPTDLPAGTRLGYPYKMLEMHRATDVIVEGLTFDGGLVREIPMPGHHQRTAVWISSLFSYGEGPVDPPCRNVVVRHCRFRDLYGRGVAMYNVQGSSVLGCRFEDVEDEAIDFDHFAFGCRAAGNDVRRAVWGIALNDASRCTVEYNRIDACRIGITIWWLDRFDPAGLNEHNLVRHNVITGSEDFAIDLQKNARHNTIEHNFHEGDLQLLEAENTVRANTRL